jgi:Spy/CpxP family protein refolding chaperone
MKSARNIVIMTSIRKTILMAAASAMTVVAFAGAAAAQQQSRPTPPKWGYELREGKRVPRDTNRVTKPDGSWREETRQGKCVTVKERSATGEYKETRQCDGNGR